MLERELELKYAKKNIISAVEKLGLEFDLDKLSSNTYIAKLLKDGTEVDRGIGKGFEEQAIISSLFESVEHYSLKNNNENLKTISKDYIIQSYEEYNKDDISLLKLSDNEDFLCREYLNFNDDSKLLVPELLVNPDFIKSRAPINKYSTNNGTSIGSTFDEALLHSLGELIERDSISMFLIDYFLNNFCEIDVLNNSNLDNDLINLLKIIRDYGYEDIKIIMLSNEFNVPTFMTVATKENNIFPMYGAGSSLFKKYAIERSIYECIQLIEVSMKSDVIKKENEDTLMLYKNYPKLNKIFLLDFSNANINYVDYHDTKLITHYDVEDLVRILSNILNQKGYHIFYHILEENDEYCCLHVKIPMFETFHLVLYGQPVLPRSRGYERLN
ncbi:YcaO-like family protein [Jeotgalicoccus sp. FSL K6-3177]|uniref:YcaO-like family protein n=1 Tax=Jeotgalicoccus sp. FSL K6-3177 TaxID=2921494 RepID=UPI0030FDC469